MIEGKVSSSNISSPPKSPQNRNNKENPTYIPFHMKVFWEKYYKKIHLDNYNDWYFELHKQRSKLFNINSFDLDAEILLLGVGNTKMVDYFLEKNFTHISMVDFSDTLIEWIKSKYEANEKCEEWDCML
jgi:hypothetical protein